VSTKEPYLNSSRVFHIFSLCAELETMYNAKDAWLSILFNSGEAVMCWRFAQIVERYNVAPTQTFPEYGD